MGQAILNDAYLPILWLLLEKKRFVSFALLNALVFFIGYTQFFLIINIFLFMYFLLTNDIKRYWKRLFSSYTLTIVLILPLLLPILGGFLNSARVQGVDSPLITSIKVPFWLIGWLGGLWKPYEKSTMVPPGMLTFYPLGMVAVFLLIINMKNVWRDVSVLLSEREYFIKRLLLLSSIFLLMHGYLEILLFSEVRFVSIVLLAFLEASTIVLFWYAYKNRNNLVGIVGLALLFALLSSGVDTIFSFLIFPYYAIFRWPFKWYLVVGCALTVLTAHLLQHYSQSISRKYVTACLIVWGVWVVGIYSIFNQTITFNTDLLPYDHIHVPSEIVDPQGRNVAVAFPGNHLLTQGLIANYSTYFNTLSWLGYDPMIPREKASIIDFNHTQHIQEDEYYQQRQKLLQAYGVKYYMYPAQHELPLGFLKQTNFVTIADNTIVGVSEDTDAQPIVFVDEGTPVVYHINGNTLEVDLGDTATDTPHQLTLGFMKTDDNWFAKTDQGMILPVEADQFQRLTVSVPSGIQILRVSYIDSVFWLGVKVSAAMLAMLGGVYMLYKRVKL